ncbi:MAG TPA: metallopeptidase family protein [Opitutaceae bacterium]|nr:metallopeptidase family protein [Opitutaceae bacterium]
MRFPRLADIAAQAVAAVQRKFPPEIGEAARRVPVHCEHAPPPDVLADGFPDDLLGLFTGSTRVEEETGGHPAPPQIFLYLDNLWDYAEEDVAVFREEVRLTYLHELGHYLGWDEGQLAARGLD